MSLSKFKVNVWGEKIRVYKRVDNAELEKIEEFDYNREDEKHSIHLDELQTDARRVQVNFYFLMEPSIWITLNENPLPFPG